MTRKYYAAWGRDGSLTLLRACRERRRAPPNIRIHGATEMKLKCYLIFSGNEYYPNGGFNDFHGSFDDLQDATL